MYRVNVAESSAAGLLLCCCKMHIVDPLESGGNYSVTSNSMKLVH